MTLPDPEAICLDGYPDGKPRMGVRIGHMVFTLRQADDYLLKLMDACASVREAEGRVPMPMKCRQCKREWLTKQYGSARCPNYRCKVVNKVPERTKSA